MAYLMVIYDHPPILISPVKKELILIKSCMVFITRWMQWKYHAINCFTVYIFSITTGENMRLLACLIFMPTVFTSTSQTCKWVPKGYFPSCSYRYHRINKERELKKHKLASVPLGRFKRHYSWKRFCDFLAKKSPALCFGPGSKMGNGKESYEIQYGCEKRNVEFGISNQRGLESLCCSKSDLSKIFEYFRETWVTWHSVTRHSLSHMGPMILHICVGLAYLTPLLRDIWRNRKHSRLYKGCLKIINKALQNNLESVSVNAKNVGYLKTMKALCIKCKTQSGSKKPSTSKKPKKPFNFDRSCFSKCLGRF